MRILEIGGDAPPSDTLVTVLWASMDPNTKAYVAGNIDLDTMEYVELRQAVMTYTGLITSTTTKACPSAMDISAIESVATDSKSMVPSDAAGSQGLGSQQEEWNEGTQPGDWSGDAYWPEGEADWYGGSQEGEQINGIKGKGKGEGKGDCFSCGQPGHIARDCVGTPLTTLMTYSYTRSKGLYSAAIFCIPLYSASQTP